MRILVQRVRKASVDTLGNTVGKIDQGLLLFVGFTEGDTLKEIDYLADKVIHLRVFDDENGIMNKSLCDIQGSILSISQFTLYADTTKGRRPSYVKALSGSKATVLFDKFNEKLRSMGIHTETGIFGADMQVSILNDGPVTVMLEKEA